MRIAFLGKGGSGKTTIAGAFATYLHEYKKTTLVVDADLNMHLNKIIGIEDNQVRPISRSINSIIDYVKGSKSDDKHIPFISYTPPNRQSRFIYLNYEDEFLKKYTVQNSDGLRLMVVGTYENTDIGFTCYHGKIDSFIIFLNHLLDRSNEYLVVDSVTGIDNLGNPLVFSYDLNVFLVEPTYKSIQVYKDFIEGIKRLDFPVNVVVIGNKIETKSDEDFILENINTSHLVACIPKSNKLKLVEQGNKIYFKEMVYENSSIFEKILKILDSTEKNWDLYLKNIRSNFIYMAQNYYNKYYNIDLDSQIDSNFSYKDVI